MKGPTPECPKLCPDCPMLPPGIEAIVRGIRPLTGREMLLEHQGRTVDLVRITFEVTASASRDVEVGDRTTADAHSGGQSDQAIIARFEQCKGPKRGVLRTLLGGTACGATN